MRPKRTKDAPLASAPLPEVSSSDRAVLTNAYKAGLIVAWKRDATRGYQVTLTGREEYVEVAKLPGYLEKLKGAA